MSGERVAPIRRGPGHTNRRPTKITIGGSHPCGEVPFRNGPPILVEMPTFTSQGAVNSVLWFTSLRPEEQGVTRRILDDLLAYLSSIGVHHQVFEVGSAASSLPPSTRWPPKLPGKLQPILHFDMHGSVENGFSVAATGETISWDDVAIRLSAVNSALGNNLFVVSCAAIAALGPEARLAQPLSLLRPDAPERLVTAGFLEEALVPFYRAVFDRGDFVAACRSHLSPGFVLYHSERLLLLALVKYVRRHCIGRGGGSDGKR